ncbi:hypothetical protein [Streptomyces enissocaesilis]|uniref:Uncharacterized protein n=1 Tax=Streptomyces enissocaesilis TaxID=332589 RepID=A0ABN3X8F6_9ACTN
MTPQAPRLVRVPLTGRPELYLQGVAEETAARYGEVVARPADADLAVLRLRTPHEPRATRFEPFFPSGSLAFPDDGLKEVLRLLDAVPSSGSTWNGRLSPSRPPGGPRH